MKKRFGSVLLLALAGVAPAVCAIDLGGILSTAQRIADTAKPAADPAAQEKLLG